MTADLERRWLDSLSWGVLAVARDLGIVDANLAAATILGSATAGDLRGRSLPRLCRVEPHGWMEATVRDVADGHPAPRPIVLDARCGDLPEDPAPTPLRIHVLGFPDGDRSLVTVVLEPLPETDHEDRAEVLIDRFLQIASHVRHEINNPLMGVLGYAELLESRADLPDEARERIRAMREEAEKIRDHVRDLGAIRRDPT